MLSNLYMRKSANFYQLLCQRFYTSHKIMYRFGKGQVKSLKNCLNLQQDSLWEKLTCTLPVDCYLIPKIKRETTHVVRTILEIRIYNTHRSNYKYLY